VLLPRHLFHCGNAGLCSHLGKRTLGRGKRWVEKQPRCLEGVEEGRGRARLSETAFANDPLI